MVATAHQLDPLANFTWEAAHLDKALALLALRAGFTEALPDAMPTAAASPQATLYTTAAHLNLTLYPQTIAYRHALAALADLAPAIVPLSDGRYLALLHSGPLGARLLARDGAMRRVGLPTLRAAIFAPAVARVQAQLSAQFASSGISAERQPLLTEALAEDYLYETTTDGIWRVRAAGQRSSRSLWWASGVPLLLALEVAARVVWYGLFFGALAVLAGVAAEGRVDGTLLLLGVLIYLSRIPLGFLFAWLERWLALRIGLLNKRLLFNGALNLPQDEVVQAGSGQFLSYLLASERLTEAWLNRGGWFRASSVFLLLTVIVLALLGDLLGALFVGGWLLLSFGVVWWLARRYSKLDDSHTTLTRRQLERLQGHTTRLLQENDWQDAPDREVAAYLRRASQRDTSIGVAWTWLPYGALLLIILVLAPDFINNPSAFTGQNAATTLRFAALLFVIYEVYYLALALPDVAKMLAAWRQMRPLRDAPQASEATAAPTNATPDEAALLSLRNVRFSYTPDGQPVLAGVSADIPGRARILMHGVSGSGKSTFAQVLNGMREPQSGLVLLRGYDLPTLGSASWRQQVVLVPQFYANHIFDASLAFNVLMGRTDAPTAADLDEAERVCRDLGLGDLIDQMPDGLGQVVGANGWQLSHGERNRVFIARALLQRADLTIFDESFVALDPTLLQTALTTVQARANAILIISHEA